jgi:hypothetical protein
MANPFDAVQPSATPAPQPTGAAQNPFAAVTPGGNPFKAVQSNPLSPTNQSVSTTSPPPTAHRGPSTWQNELRGLKNVGTAASKALTFPLQAIGDITGAPQRFVSGIIGSPEDTGAAGLGSAMYEVFHPSQQATFDVQGERRMHLDKWFEGISKLPGDTPIPLTLPGVGGAAPITITNTAEQWKQMGRDTIYENITDPVNLLFGAGAARRGVAKVGEKAFQSLGELATSLGERGGPVGGLVKSMRVAPDLKAALRPRAAGTAMAMENSANAQADAIEAEQKSFIAKLEAAAKPWTDAHNAMVAAAGHPDPSLMGRLQDARDAIAVKPSDVFANNRNEIRRLLNQDAYVIGAPHVRAEALAHGFKPTAQQINNPVLNILGGYRDEYLPNKSWFEDLPDEEHDTPATLQMQRMRPGVAGFTKHRYGPNDVPEEDLIPTLAKRLQKGVAQVRRHLGKQQILNTYAPIMPNLAKTDQMIQAERAANPASPRLTRLLSLRDAQTAKIAQIEAQLAATNRGQEPVSFADFLEKRGMTALNPQKQALQTTAWRQALRNKRITPATMAQMGAPGAKVPKPFSKELDVTGAQRFMRGQQMAADKAQRLADEAARAEGKTAQGVGKASETGVEKVGKQGWATATNVASAGQKGITRAERIATRAGKGADIGRLQASAAKTATQTSEAATAGAKKVGETAAKTHANVTKTLADSLTLAKRAALRAQKARTAADKATAEVQRRMAYNAAWNAINDEATSVMRTLLDRDVPKGLAEHLAPPPTKSTGVPLLKGVSEVVRQQFFANPIVHGVKNEGTLAILGEAGFKGAVHGIAIALGYGGKEQYAKDVARLQAMGAASNMAAAPTDTGKIVGTFARIAKPMKKLTSRFDMGQRMALLHWLDTTNEVDELSGKPYAQMSDLEKASVINDTQFEYQHTSAASKALRSVGAPFPHWRTTIVATMARQMMKRPHVINLLARTVNDANMDFLSGEPYEFEPGLPAEDVVKPLSASYWANYFGPLTETLKIAGNKQMTAGQKAGAILYNQEPYLRLIGEPLGISPYHSKATSKVPPVANALAESFGSYFQAKPKP